MPALPGATDAHRREGRRLAAIHMGHVRDLHRIERVLTRIEAGDAPPEELRKIVLSLDMAENFRAFGTLCGRECRALNFHHNAEEYGMFPKLESVGHEALGKLVAKLRSEHEVIHELIRRLERAAMTLMFDPSDAAFQEAALVFRHLDAGIRLHFGYEETQLEEALGFFLDEI